MKRILLFGVLMMVGGGVSYAATMCVALDPTALEYCARTDGNFTEVDWRVSCLNTVVLSMVEIHGIAICADQDDDGPLDTVRASGRYSYYCWCRIISPVVSPWFRMHDVPSDDCDSLCTDYCANYVASNNGAAIFEMIESVLK